MGEYLNLIFGLLITSFVGFIAKIWYDNQQKTKKISEIELKNEVNNIEKAVSKLSGADLVKRFNELFGKRNNSNPD